MKLEIAAPNEQELILQSKSLLDMAKMYVIDSPEMYQLAGDELKKIKAKTKELDAQRKQITKPLDDAKAAVMALFKKPLEALTQAEGVLKNSLLSFDREQERKRQEEEKRLREIARAEQERLQAQARAAEEESRKLIEAGKKEEAEQLAAKAATIEISSYSIPVPIVAQAQTKVAGISKRTIWKARVIKKESIPLEYMEPNQSALDKVAQATKGTIQIPGVEFYSEDILSSGSR